MLVEVVSQNQYIMKTTIKKLIIVSDALDEHYYYKTLVILK